MALTVAALVLHSRNTAVIPDASELYLADVWLAVITPPAGAFLLSRGFAPLLGIALLSAALLSVGTFSGMYGTYVMAVEPGAAPFGRLAAWLATWTSGPYLLLMIVVPMLVPAGRPLSRTWGSLALSLVVLIGAISVMAAFSTGPVEAYPLLSNPLGLGQAAWLGSATDAVIVGTVLFGAPLAFVSVVIRWRRRRDEQTPMTLFLGSVALLVIAILSAESFPYPWSDLIPASGFTAVIATIVIVAAMSASANERGQAALKLNEARAAERDRVGRDLHDGVGPNLAGVALQLNAIASSVDDGPLKVRLLTAETALRRAATEVRRIIDATVPPPLEPGTLFRTLAEHAHALSQASGTTIYVKAEPLPQDLPRDVEVAAYRIACEAMTNVVKHAQARRCVVRLHADTNGFALEVQDDGCGLTGDIPTGVGLNSMQMRAEEAGGTLQTSQSPGGAGLRLCVLFPLRAP